MMSMLYGLARMVIVFFILLLMPLQAKADCPTSANEQIKCLTDAAILLDDSALIPSEEAPWQRQMLPDNWNHSRPGTGGFAWYRLHFDVANTDEMVALYINRASMNAAIYLNGQLIGTGGTFEEPVARNWNRPIFHLAPATLLIKGRNTIHIRLRAYARSQGGLNFVEVGPEKILAEQYERALFLTITAGQITSLFTITMAMLFLLLWCCRRQDTIYLFFGLAMAIWGLHGLKLFVRTIPIPVYYWELLTALFIPIFTAVLVPFVLRFTKQTNLKLEMVGYCSLGGLLLAHMLLGVEHLYTLASTGFAVSTLISGILFYHLAAQCVRSPSVYRVLIVVAGGICVALAVHDLLWQRALLTFSSRPLLHFGGPLLFLGMGGEMISRFLNALYQAEELNRTLESRVQEKSIELAASFARMADLEQERKVIQERQRIMRDMHDGIGGQLITAISRVRATKLNQDEMLAVLTEVLDDLRLIIDSLQGQNGDLTSALGNFRYRMEPRLKSIGITLLWQLDGTPEKVDLPPSSVLHVLRIVQESFTNILKHSGATQVIVSSRKGTAPNGDYCEIAVADNGKGMSPSRIGYGIKNMMYRASLVGATAALGETAQTGTTFSINIPYGQPAATS
jgi:signal transduction histidine kinase